MKTARSFENWGRKVRKKWWLGRHFYTLSWLSRLHTFVLASTKEKMRVQL